MSELGKENLTDLLVTAVRDLRIGDTDARADAARRLGSARSPLAVSYLVEGLSDPAVEVRRAAVEALGEIGHPSGINPLRSLLEKETNPLLESRIILEAIARIREANPEITPPDSRTAANLPVSSITENQTQSPTAENQFGSADPLEKAFKTTADGLRAEETRQRLEETYRRAAAQRQLIEKARRQSIDEANRRVEQDRLRLEAEEKSLTRAQAELEQRHAQLQVSRAAAAENDRKVKEIQEQIKTEERARQQLEQESLRLQAEIQELVSAENARVEALQSQLAAAQQRKVEHEQTLQRGEELRVEAEAKHRVEEERLASERQKLDRAREQLASLRAGVEAARAAAEDEIIKLKEATERIASE